MPIMSRTPMMPVGLDRSKQQLEREEFKSSWIRLVIFRTEAFPLLGQSGRWIVFGVRSNMRDSLPFEAIPAMIEKNITLSGFEMTEARFRWGKNRQW